MYKFLIPLFALALLIGCTPKTTPVTDQYNADQSSSTAMMEDQPTSTATTPPDSDSTPPSMQASSVYPSGFDGTMLTGMHTVTLKTSMGDITVELNADKAPKTVTNFVMLSKMGYYNGLTFHRVIPSFMIQGGDPSGNGTGGNSVYGDSFEDEANDLQMKRGVIAMANAGPNTNGSQFFITTVDTPWLQNRHTIFGTVTKGMDVVDKMTAVQRDANDKPVKPVTFTPAVKE